MWRNTDTILLLYSIQLTFIKLNQVVVKTKGLLQGKPAILFILCNQVEYTMALEAIIQYNTK